MSVYMKPTTLRAMMSARNQWHVYAQPQLLIPSTESDELNIFGPIVDGASADFLKLLFETNYHTSDADFKAALEATNASKITVNINSPGGDVDAGGAIRTLMQEYQQQGREFNVRILGMAASMATLVALAGNHVAIGDMGKFFIHRAMAYYDNIGMDNEDGLKSVIEDMEARLQHVRQTDKAMLDVYGKRTGIAHAELREMIRKQTTFNAQNALDKKWVDEIIAQDSNIIKLPAVAERPLPEGLKIAASAEGIIYAVQRPTPTPSPAPAPTPAPSPSPQPQPGASIMYEQQIRAALGLSATTEVTDEHRNQYMGQLISRNQELETENGTLKAQVAGANKATRRTRAESMLNKHVDRGACLPFERDQYLTEMDSMEDGPAEERLAFLSSFMEPLKDECKAPRKPLGSGDPPPGGGSTGDNETQTLARAWRDTRDELTGKGTAMDQAMTQAEAKHPGGYKAYNTVGHKLDA